MASPLDTPASSPATPAVKPFKPEVFQKFHTLTREEREELLASLPEERGIQLIQAYKSWRDAEQARPPLDLRQAGFLPPLDTELPPMSFAPAPEPSWNAIETPKGFKVTLGGYKFDLDKASPLDVLVPAVGVVKAVRNIQRFKGGVIDPILRKGQDYLRENVAGLTSEDKYRYLGGGIAQTLEGFGVSPERAANVGTAGVYLGMAAGQFLLGERALSDMPEDLKLRAINEIESIVSHPLFDVTPLGLLHPATRSAGTTSLAVEGGKFPLYILGPGKWLQGIQRASPVVGGAVTGAVVAGRESFLDPTQRFDASVIGGAAIGAGLPVLGAAAKAVGTKAVIASHYASQFVRELSELASGKYADDLFGEALEGAAATMSREANSAVAKSGPVWKPDGKQAVEVWGEKAGNVLSEMTQKPRIVPWVDNFDPSVVLVDNKQALAIRLTGDGAPPVIQRIDITTDKGLGRARALVDESRVHVEFFGNRFDESAGVAEGMSPRVRKAFNLKSERLSMGDDLLVLEQAAESVDPTGKVDIYRLGTAKAREKVYAERNLVKFTTENGKTKYGFLLGVDETPEGNLIAYLSPGDDKHLLPNFVKQVTPIVYDKSGNVLPGGVAQATKRAVADASGTLPGKGAKGSTPWQRLSSDELRELAKVEPMPVRQAAKKLERAAAKKFEVASFDDLQRKFNGLYEKLTPDRRKLIEHGLNRTPAASGKTAKKEAKSLEKAVNFVAETLGVSDDMAELLVENLRLVRLGRALGNKDKQRVLAEQIAKNIKVGESLFKAGQQDYSKIFARGIPGEVVGRQGPVSVVRKDAASIPTQLPEILPRSGAKPVDVPQMPRTPPQPSNVVKLADGREGKVLHAEVTPDGKVGDLVVRGADGKVFTVNESQVVSLGKQPVEPLMLGSGPRPDGYYKTDVQLADDLAWTIRNYDAETGEKVWNEIIRQAMKDGWQEGVIAHAVRGAQQAATDTTRNLRPPSFLSNGGAPPKPPPPPPPPGTPPRPPEPGMIPESDEVVILAAVKDRGFIDRMRVWAFGNRAVVEKDIGSLINMRYGAKNIAAEQDKLLRTMRRRFGEKVMSDFDRDLLKVFEAPPASRNEATKELAAKYPDILDNPKVRAEVESYMMMRDKLERELADLGLIDPAKFSDEELQSYVTHIYARYALPPGEWAKMVKKDIELYQYALDYFTAYYTKMSDETVGPARTKAVETVERLIGATETPGLRVARKGDAAKSLKGRVLDEMEREAILGLPTAKIDEEGVRLIRRLLGRNESGMMAMATTIARQRQLIATHKMWNDLTMNYPQYVSRYVDEELVNAGWKKVPDNRTLYGNAAGKYLHPDVYESLITQPERVSTANKLISAISSWVKGNETALGGPQTYNSSFFGNIVYAALAGADPLSGTMPYFGRAARDIYGAWKSPTSAEAGRIADLLRLGVDAPSFGQSELVPVQREIAAYYNKQLGGSDEVTAASIARVTWDGFNKFRRIAAGGLEVVDRLWRISTQYALEMKGGYDRATGEVDLEKAAKFLVGNPRIEAWRARMPDFSGERFGLPPMSQEDLIELVKREAALRVTSSFPMPDRVSAAVDAGRQNFGWFAKYLTFITEDARIWTSIPQRIARGEKDLAWRLVGYAAATGGVVGYLLPELRKLNGISEEEVAAAKANLPASARGYSPLLTALPFRDSQGRVQFVDMSRYLGPAAYLRGVDLENLGMGSVGAVLKNMVVAPVEGGAPEGFASEALGRMGWADPKYRQKLREDQKGVAAGLDYFWKELGLLPKVGSWASKLAADVKGDRTHSALTDGQAAARVLGFTVLPSGEKERTAAARAGPMMLKASVREQTGTVLEDPEKRTLGPASAIREAAVGRKTKQQQIQEIVDKRRKDIEEYRRVQELNRKAGK